PATYTLSLHDALPISLLRLNLPADGIENRRDREIEQGSIGLISALVSGHGIATAQNKVLCRTSARSIRAVARGVGRSEQCHYRRPQRHGKMQRPSVAANDAERVT